MSFFATDILSISLQKKLIHSLNILIALNLLERRKKEQKMKQIRILTTERTLYSPIVQDLYINSMIAVATPQNRNSIFYFVVVAKNMLHIHVWLSIYVACVNSFLWKKKPEWKNSVIWYRAPKQSRQNIFGYGDMEHNTNKFMQCAIFNTKVRF